MNIEETNPIYLLNNLKISTAVQNVVLDFGTYIGMKAAGCVDSGITHGLESLERNHLQHSFRLVPHPFPACRKTLQERAVPMF